MTERALACYCRWRSICDFVYVRREKHSNRTAHDFLPRRENTKLHRSFSFSREESMIVATCVAVGIVAIVLILIVLQWGDNAASIDGTWPFYARKVLTDAEQILYHRLVQAMPECIIFAQVQLSQILGVKNVFNDRAWRNRISHKSVDFVVCLKDSTIVAAIELDDSTHLRGARKKADAVKDKALTSAGVAILRWHVRNLPDSAAIRQALTT